MGALTHGVGAFAISASFFLALALGALFLRLSEGPVSLGPLAELVTQRLNAAEADQRFRIGDVVLALGREGRPSGLRLRDVTVLDVDGSTIARAPEIGVNFRAWDAMRGDIAPTQIRLDGTEATLRRAVDGTFSFNFGEGGGGGGFFDLLRAAERDEGALRKLRRVEARDVALTYDDRASGQSWTAGGVDIAVWRYGGALFGSLSVAADLGDGRRMRLSLTGDRPLTSGETTLSASFSGAEGPDIGAQIPELSWLDGVRAPIGGTLSLKLGDDGSLADLSGRLEIGRGEAVSADGARTAIRSAAVTLDYDAGRDRFTIGDARVATDALSVRADGTADVTRAGDGGITGLVLQTDLSDLVLAPPGVFAAPLSFEAGKATLRLRLDPLRIELGEARLLQGATRLTASGTFLRREGAWRTELRFGARNMPAVALTGYWPPVAAAAARSWTERNIRAGVIERVSGFARIGGDNPVFALDFTHRALEAEVVPGMSPIIRAAGAGHLDPKRFAISVDDGDVELASDRVIAMDGSTFLIPDVTTYPATASTRLRARGRIVDILALIDQEPLRLTSKFGADLGGVQGDAVVTADLAFPLVAGLTAGMIDVIARAELSDVRYPTPFGGLTAAAERLSLIVTPERLDIEGPAALGPLAGDFAWSERFRATQDGAEPRTTMTLATRLDADAMRRLGLDAVAFERGHAPTTIRLTANGGGPLAVALNADLGPARLAAPALGLRKGEGPGSLAASGVLSGGLRITSLKATAPGFNVEGDATLGPDFSLRDVDLSRFEVDGHTALAIGFDTGDGGARTIDVRGRKLDLQWLAGLDFGEGGGSAPTRAKVAIERLRLTESLMLRDATGDVTVAAGATEARISGGVNGGAVAELAYTAAADGAAKVRITARDAGAFLRDAGYFENGYGGALRLDAALGPEGVENVEGELAIDGIVVRNAPALANILSIASLIGLFDSLQSGGITFSEVRAPFAVRGRRITLDDATALGPAMGIKMRGGYETATDRIDMTGVLTPAYVLNSVLSRVPVLGQVMGGEGEGLFAFTFSVRGSKDAPAISVNPLSVLTPGVLRNVFTADGARPAQSAGPAPSPAPATPATPPAAGQTDATAPKPPEKAASQVAPPAPPPPPKGAASDPGVSPDK